MGGNSSNVFDTRGIIAKIRQAVTKAAKKKDFDEHARRRLYRNTLVDSLRQAAQKLCYGRERERILAKITELADKVYVAVKIKDGDRAGQIISNDCRNFLWSRLNRFPRSILKRAQSFGKVSVVLQYFGGTVL